METTDESLVLACRRGDESAWEKLVLRYQRLVYSIPRRAGLDESLASDVFQNVFTNLVARLDQIEQPDRVQAWLVTATRRETWRLILKQKSWRRFSDGPGDDDAETIEVQDNAPLPEEELLRLERQHSVRAAVSLLDDRCRELVTLLFYSAEPPPYSDVAAKLGLPEGSIGPTRARCLKKLMRILESAGL